MKYLSIDMFSGIGGLTEGMHLANFKTVAAFEIDPLAAEAYEMNHPKTKVVIQDIRKTSIASVKRMLKGKRLHLLAGCPPCQGFSSIRKKNKRRNVRDERNSLILEYLRFVKGLRPYTIMMENVPGVKNYYLFKKMVGELKGLGYNLDVDIVNVKHYGVPQSRRRLVLIGSRLGHIKIAEPTNERVTVRDAIGRLPLPRKTTDKLHKIFPNHTKEVRERIRLTPKNGGSRSDLPRKFRLNCHKDEEIGFNDVYGRLGWNECSTTITGGCLNPSKGRFLHPSQNRCISAREAALLQSFPRNYKLPIGMPLGKTALLIGNALPPKFSFLQSENIRKHLKVHLG